MVKLFSFKRLSKSEFLWCVSVNVWPTMLSSRVSGAKISVLLYFQCLDIKIPGRGTAAADSGPLRTNMQVGQRDASVRPRGHRVCCEEMKPPVTSAFGSAVSRVSVCSRNRV